MKHCVVWRAANVVLEGALERIIVGALFCDLPLGLYIIRGENVVLIGELVGLTFTPFFFFEVKSSKLLSLVLSFCVLCISKWYNLDIFYIHLEGE